MHVAVKALLLFCDKYCGGNNIELFMMESVKYVCSSALPYQCGSGSSVGV